MAIEMDFQLTQECVSEAGEVRVKTPTRNTRSDSISADHTAPKILSMIYLEMRGSMSSTRLTFALLKVIPDLFRDQAIIPSCGMCFPEIHREIWGFRIREADTIIYT